MITLRGKREYNLEVHLILHAHDYCVCKPPTQKSNGLRRSLEQLFPRREHQRGVHLVRFREILARLGARFGYGDDLAYRGFLQCKLRIRLW